MGRPLLKRSLVAQTVAVLTLCTFNKMHCVSEALINGSHTFPFLVKQQRCFLSRLLQSLRPSLAHFVAERLQFLAPAAAVEQRDGEKPAAEMHLCVCVHDGNPEHTRVL